MAAALAPGIEMEALLALRTLRTADARAQLLAAVRELGRDGAPFTLERLQQLLRVEAHFESLLERDARPFLAATGPLSDEDREFALNAQRLFLESANGLQRFLRNRKSWATSRESLELMFRVTGLALHAVHGFVKWGYFVNEPGRPVPWRQLHALYLLAEADGYGEAPFALHEPGAGPSCVRALYLRTLLLDQVNTGNLSRIGIERADGHLSAWCRDYRLDDTLPSEGPAYWVDLASESGLQALRKPARGDCLRFVGAGAMAAQLVELRAAVRDAEPGAGPGGEQAEVLSAFDKLYESALCGDDIREAERTTLEDLEVDVIVGAERVLRRLRAGRHPGTAGDLSETRQFAPLPPANPDRAGDEPAPGDPEVERWRVHDLGAGGYGLIVDRETADLVSLNGLVALRHAGHDEWMVATVVRKRASRVRGEVLVGVELLGRRPIAVQLCPEGAPAVAALYLAGDDPDGALDTLLARPADLRPGLRCTLRSAGIDYRIRPHGVPRRGCDWISAGFEIEPSA